MNHKQKIGYTFLGAFIILIGMLIDNLTSPPVTAQNNGELTCQKLTFVDETGMPLFTLNTEIENRGDFLFVRGKDGKKIMGLTRFLFPSVSVYSTEEVKTVSLLGLGRGVGGGAIYTKNSEGKTGTLMSTDFRGGAVKVYDEDGKKAIELKTTGPLMTDRAIMVHSKDGKTVISLTSDEYGAGVAVVHKDSGSAEMSIDDHGGRIDVFNKQGEIAR